MGILVLFKNLKTINGIYQNDYRKKIIHINENLDHYLKRQVCAHELGHAVLHKSINSFFWDKCTFMLTNKIEVEANLFAAELLIKDDDIISNYGHNLEYIAACCCVTENLVEYKLRLFHKNI